MNNEEEKNFINSNYEDNGQFEKKLTKTEAALVLRKKVDTVGIIGEPGEQIQKNYFTRNVIGRMGC